MSLAEIKKLLGSKKLVIGTDRVLKNIRLGKLKKVYLSANCNLETVTDIKQYANFSEVEILQLDIPNDELGTVCKKPFLVSVIGILR